MPTGYTAEVAEGKVTDFRTFALRCARAFGATIMQRDDPMSDLPKLREESPYYREALERAQARYAELHAMSREEIQRAAEADYADLMRGYRERLAEMALTRGRYESMLAEVLAWAPPTPEHAKLKEFMEEQLRQSLQFDIYEPDVTPCRSSTEWRAEEIRRAEERVAYAAKRLAEEKKAVAGANAWIQALYNSLPAGEPASKGAGAA